MRWAGALANGNAIAEVIAEQEFECGAARGFDFRRFAGDHHAVGCLCRAGGREARVVADANDARQARGPVFFHAGHEAERWNVDAELPSGIQHSATVWDCDRFAVNGESDLIIRHASPWVQVMVLCASDRDI